MIILPPRDTKKLVQTNRGNILGHLWSSWSIDLQSNPGAIRVGSKMKINTNTAGAANLGLPVAFRHFDSLMWCVAGSRVFKSSGNNLITAFTEDASTGAVTTYDSKYSDMEVFMDKLFVSGNATSIYYKDTGSGAGSWTAIASAFATAATPHKLAYLKKHNRLYWTSNQTTIRSLKDDLTTIASSGDYYLDLTDINGYISTIAASSDKIWIGTFRPTNNFTLQSACVFEWDGISNQAVRIFYIDDSQAILAIIIKDDIPYVIDNRGRLLVFNGSSFTEVGRLPINTERLGADVSNWNLRSVHPNGLTVTKDGTILALVQNVLADNANSIKENFPSGIWEWSSDHGFVHKHPLTLQPMATTTITDNGQNKLYSDLSNDIMGVGALSVANLYSTSASGRSDLICGARYYTDSTTDTYGIFIKAPIPTDNATTTESKKYGYFVTQFIQATGLKDAWKTLALKYKKLLNSSDRIIVKYRTTEADPTYISITWVNTTSFTTTTDVSAMTGYEVEILQGTGSGKCAHISSVTGSGTYTVTLDETFTGVTTGTAKARVQAWKKKLEVSDQLTESAVTTLGTISERIQLKVCMEFTGDDELFELVLVNGQHTKLE